MRLDTMQFFDKLPSAIPLYASLEEHLLFEYSDVTIKVQKTQISFYNRHMFACVSLPRTRKEQRLVLTLGLPYRIDSPRIWQSVEPYPGRWTNHLLIDALDDELLAWIDEAYHFAMAKK